MTTLFCSSCKPNFEAEGETSPLTFPNLTRMQRPYLEKVPKSTPDVFLTPKEFLLHSQQSEVKYEI